MTFLNDRVLDFGVNEIDTNGNALHICSQEPTTYAEATATYTLGNKATPTISAPADGDTNGRKVTVSAFSDGSVSGTATATHFAIVDTVNSRLLATQALASSQAVTSGNTFSLTAIDITIPDAA